MLQREMGGFHLAGLGATALSGLGATEEDGCHSSSRVWVLQREMGATAPACLGATERDDERVLSSRSGC